MQAKAFLEETKWVLSLLDERSLDSFAKNLADIKESGGRLFILGVGGNAANASHAANDFRKLANIEAYAPTDNIAELTARTNDTGWDSVFIDWLKVSKLNNRDALLVLSVGGGSVERKLSVNLVDAIIYAKGIPRATVFGIVGMRGGKTGELADFCIRIPQAGAGLVTPITESFISLILHLLVSHEALKEVNPTW